jgi:hypothetical protein
MRVIVCGGRDFTDRDLLFSELDKHSADWGPFKVVIEGGQRTRDKVTGKIIGGADYWAACWADERGVSHETYKANWTEFGRAAGPLRNQRMIDEGKPDLIIAFPGGTGTHDMISRGNKAKLQQIWIISDRETNTAAR